MRVIVTADTHYHPHWADTLQNFVSEIASLQPDCFIVAGDLGNSASGFEQMLILLERIDCPRLILTGNHDLWCIPPYILPPPDSQQLWEEILPKLTRQHGAIWLEGENWIRNGLGICGTNGWYDYTARDHKLNYTVEDYAQMKRRFIVDGDLIAWKWTDIEFANLIGEAFECRLAALEADPGVHSTWVMTHVPVFDEGVPRMPENLSWTIRNAYYGNFTLGQRILKHAKVRRAVSGHTHIGKIAQSGTIQMQIVPADYGHPAYLLFDDA